MSNEDAMAPVVPILAVVLPFSVGCGGAAQMYEGMAEGVTGEPLAVEPQSVPEGEVCTALEESSGQLPPVAIRIDSTYWNDAHADTAANRETLVAAVTYLNRTEEQSGLTPPGGWFYAERGTGDRIEAQEPSQGPTPTVAPADSLSRNIGFRLSRQPYRILVSTTGEPGGDACRFDVSPEASRT